MIRLFADYTFPPADHASRPNPTTTPAGALYPCTDHGIVYRCDGTVWATWASGATIGA